MHYIMSKDVPVIEVETGRINRTYMNLAPYALRLNKKLTSDDTYRWLKERALPLSRKNSEKIYKALGLARDNTEIQMMYLTHSLSVNDNYWIADESELNHLKYDDISLFKNSFNKAMYLVALRGDDGYTITDKHISAEYTGKGNYPKCFVREQDGIYIYKNSTNRAMYYEVISSQIANVLGFKSVDYVMSDLGDIKCTKSKIASDITVNWETAADLAAFFDQTEYKIPQEFMLRARTLEYCNMIIFDALILNDDRHMKNWAFEFDADTNELIGLAPSYDYNNAFNGDKNTLSLLLFNGNRHVNILSAARIAYRDYENTLDFSNLINYIDSYDLRINKQALKNRIKYIKGEKSNQNDCYEV